MFVHPFIMHHFIRSELSSFHPSGQLSSQHWHKSLSGRFWGFPKMHRKHTTIHPTGFRTTLCLYLDGHAWMLTNVLPHTQFFHCVSKDKAISFWGHLIVLAFISRVRDRVIIALYFLIHFYFDFLFWIQFSFSFSHWCIFYYMKMLSFNLECISFRVSLKSF